MIPPFVELGDRTMVVVNWAPDLEGDHLLILRPLKPGEKSWLEKALADAYHDVYARLFPTDEERLRGALLSAASSDAI